MLAAVIILSVAVAGLIAFCAFVYRSHEGWREECARVARERDQIRHQRDALQVRVTAYESITNATAATRAAIRRAAR